MLLSGRTPAIFISLGNAGARRFNLGGIFWFMRQKHRVQSPIRTRKNSVLIVLRLTSFQPTPPTPGANSRPSVDDLICSHLYCCRYCQTECFQGLLVNHKTEAGRLLEWEIGGARSS
jgi:hypothetical protein